MTDRRPEDQYGEEQPRVVIRDKRKVSATGDVPPSDRAVTDPAASSTAGSGPDVGAAAATMSSSSSDAATSPSGPEPPETVASGGEPSDPQPSVAERALAERTLDLQRLQAEYANYRKRVDRDRIAVGELATGRVLDALLPVLDDLERAAQHGDLTGAFKTVADKLQDGLARLGLAPFGEVGDPFDPSIHEAVMHGESDEVTVPTATMIMRRGYRQGERLLRPAMVGVTDPIHPAVADDAVAPPAQA